MNANHAKIGDGGLETQGIPSLNITDWISETLLDLSDD